MGDSRPPHGGRGLKFKDGDITLVEAGSSPSRGTWIEITLCFLSPSLFPVVPLAGDVD